MLKIGDLTPTATADGHWTDGNVAGGVAPTRMMAGWFNAVQDELVNVLTAAGVATDPKNSAQLLAALNKLYVAPSQVPATLSGIVGSARNLAMNVTAASATATITADEIIVETALGGSQYRIGSFSKTINLSTTGAGGMDTGSAPVSGFVGLYAIFNPTTATSALMAVNATSAVLPEVYGGSNLPYGYTASALVCVVPTDSSGKIVPLLQMGRKTLIATAQLSSTAVFISTPTALNISAAVPKNAKSLDGILYLVSGQSTRPVLCLQPLGSPSAGIKQLVGGNSSGVNNTQTPFSDLAIFTPQTIYWQVSAGVAGDTISGAFTYATGYLI